MTTSATVPVTVTPEAAARIAELGFQTQVDHGGKREMFLTPGEVG